MRSPGLSSNLPPSPPSKTIPNMHITSQSREKDNFGKMKENDSDQRQGKNENKMKRTIESKEESKSFRESGFNDSSQKGYSRSKNDEINTKSGRIDDSGSGRGDDYTINKDHPDHPDNSMNYVKRNASSGIDNDGNSDEIENYFITESPEENKDQIVTSSVGASRSKNVNLSSHNYSYFIYLHVSNQHHVISLLDCFIHYSISYLISNNLPNIFSSNFS